MAGSYNFRSISLPPRSHPTTLRIQEELNKLKIREPLTSSSLKVETICVSLSGLGDLNKCIEEFLQLPVTQQAFATHQHKKWVDEVLDESVSLLDVCGTTRDIMSQMKERVQDLQSSFRRRKGADLHHCVSSFICYRKKMNKDVVKCLTALKGMDNKLGLLDLDHHLAVVVRVLREVGAVTLSIFRSVLCFLSATASKPKSRWSIISKLMNKGVVGENLNDVESVDVALLGLCCGHGSSKDAQMERMQIAQKRLEALEKSLASVEEGLESMYRRLIKTRVSLLNIVTH